MNCYVCGKKTLPRHRYCDRCAYHLRVERELVKRRNALKEAYDRDLDAFKCHWCDVVLEERDIDDPWHLCFDHIVPLRSSRLVVSSELLNSLKTELGPKEFPLAVRELAAHRDGRPFDRDCIAFSHWGAGAAQGGPEKVVGSASSAGGETQRWYCPRCRRFVQWQHRDFRARARAMREAWKEGGFCAITPAWH
jgi:hypothetical protein